MVARILSGVVAVFRLCVAAWVMSMGGSLVNVLYAAWEMLASDFAFINVLAAENVAKGMRPWRVPLFYCVGYFVIPTGAASGWWVVPMVVVLLIRTWSLFVIRYGYSVGAPTWFALAWRGPYRFVRHPLEASGVLARVVFACVNPCVWNWCGVCVMAWAAWYAVQGEEEYLGSIDEWREYSRWCPYKFVPGVI